MIKLFSLRLWGVGLMAAAVAFAPLQGFAKQERSALTPLQREIEKLRGLLSSSEVEARRDALIRLGNIGQADSSRVAATSLTDASEVVRATAAHAVLNLPANEMFAALSPLLNDKSEFVRQQVAYALGEAKSPLAVQALVAALAGDKQDSVRGAAAVALGEIGDPAAVLALAGILDRSMAVPVTGKKQKSAGRKENEFVARAAAHSLGQIRSRQGVPALLKALTDQSSPPDLRREAAAALGEIGDSSAAPALRLVLAGDDPHLSRIAHEALKRIERNGNKGGS